MLHTYTSTYTGLNYVENTQAQERVQLQQQADYIEMHRIIRNWGKFQHNTDKLKYYNISAKIRNINSEESLQSTGKGSETRSIGSKQNDTDNLEIATSYNLIKI